MTGEPVNQTLGGQTVAVYVTGPDGRPQSRPLTAREAALALAADAALRAQPATLPAAARWERAEVNGALGERDPAYLYLRYRTAQGAALEFWAHAGRQAAYDARRGVITVAGAGLPA